MISTLTRTVSHESNDWLIDSGVSKHMAGFKDSFVKLSEHESPHKVKLQDDYQYPIKGSGESSYKLDSEKSMKIKDVLFIPENKEEPTLHLCIQCKRHEGCICRWPSSYVAKGKNHR